MILETLQDEKKSLVVKMTEFEESSCQLEQVVNSKQAMIDNSREV